MPITTDQAICCLLQAVAEVLDDAGLPALDHAYLSANDTWPYCDHSAAVAHELEPQVFTQDGVPQQVGRTRSWVHQFQVTVLRGAPPAPDIDTGPLCIGGLYGDCGTAEAFDGTITGHAKGIAADRRAIMGGLLAAWCACMLTHKRPASNHTDFVRTEYVAGGRFAGTLFVVEAALG